MELDTYFGSASGTDTKRDDQKVNTPSSMGIARLGTYKKIQKNKKIKIQKKIQKNHLQVKQRTLPI